MAAKMTHEPGQSSRVPCRQGLLAELREALTSVRHTLLGNLNATVSIAYYAG